MLAGILTVPALAAGGGQSSAAPSGTADTVAHTVAELGMTLKIPADLYVFSQHTADDDPNPAQFGLDSKSFRDYFAQHDIYLNAVAAKVTHEVILTMTHSNKAASIVDLNRLSDTELTAFVKETANYQTPELTYKPAEIYTGNGQVKFIKSSFESVNGKLTTRGIQYFTINNGKAILLKLACYDDTALSDSRVAMITSIVNTATFSVVYTKPSVTPAASVSAPAGQSVKPSTQTAAAASVGAPGANASWLHGLTAGMPLLKLILVDLLVTFIVLTLPMLLVRFVIYRKAVSKEKARKAAAIDGLLIGILIVGYAVNAQNYFIVAGVVLWGITNYFVLVFKGRGRTLVAHEIISVFPDENRDESKASVQTENRTCKNCYAVNLATSKTCFYCGAAMEQEEAVQPPHQAE